MKTKVLLSAHAAKFYSNLTGSENNNSFEQLPFLNINGENNRYTQARFSALGLLSPQHSSSEDKNNQSSFLFLQSLEEIGEQ